jgi:beta-lactamase regulating signal transducer with metallopeptidase domain
MRFWILAAVSALSAFAVFTLLGTFAAGLSRRLLAPAIDCAPAARRSQLLFAVRMLPVTAAATAAFAIALPVFLWFEDRGTAEPINRTLALLAGTAACLVARGAWRAASAWRATTAVMARWQESGRQLEGLTERLPAYAIDEAFPTVAVAGIFRPRLFIAECVLRDFPAPEIAAMIAHECAHVSAFDNVKRLLMRASPDVFGIPAVEREWAAAAEEAADARAATLGPSARLDLAQALIRIARLAVPSGPQLASAFYLGGSIDARVRRLVDAPPAAATPRWLRLALPAAALLVASAVVAAAPSLHALMEQAVRLLP